MLSPPFSSVASSIDCKVDIKESVVTRPLQEDFEKNGWLRRQDVDTVPEICEIAASRQRRLATVSNGVF